MCMADKSILLPRRVSATQHVIDAGAARNSPFSHCCGLHHAILWQVDEGVLLPGHHLLHPVLGCHQEAQLHKPGMAWVHNSNEQALAAHWLARIADCQQDEVKGGLCKAGGPPVARSQRLTAVS